jgi:hypothetical protein
MKITCALLQRSDDIELQDDPVYLYQVYESST